MVEGPVLDAAISRIKSPDRRITYTAARAVEPPEKPCLDVPYGPLAEMVTTFEDAVDSITHVQTGTFKTR